MEYYKLLDFYTEPFSNSPDPNFFYGSATHLDCLHKLEISIRLKRGLCVVMAEVGAGKTTICRKLISDLAEDPAIQAHLILDPSFSSPLEMLGFLNSNLRQPENERLPTSPAGYKERIKNHLFNQAVKNNQTIVLIIDEGQKISSACLEVLRELLNYETNDYKLLQIIIFAQEELQDTLNRHPNFKDRISFFSRLAPLSRRETADFVRYRLESASAHGTRKPAVSFSNRAITKLHRLTNGHPRKIISLCHHAFMIMIIRNKTRVSAAMVQQAYNNLPWAKISGQSRFRKTFAASAAAAAILAAVFFHFPDVLKHLEPLSAFSVGQEPEKSLSSVRLPMDQSASYPDPAQALILHNEFSAQAGLSSKSVDEPDHESDISLNSDHEIIPEEKLETIPDELGIIRVSANENLWNMTERVYGHATLDLLKDIHQANPHIKNTGILYQGLRIFFPAGEVRNPDNDERYWLSQGSFEELSDAYALLLSIDPKRLRILSYWEPVSGTRHAVVWPRSFASKEGADIEAKNLPGKFQKNNQFLFLSDDTLLL